MLLTSGTIIIFVIMIIIGTRVRRVRPSSSVIVLAFTLAQVALALYYLYTMQMPEL